MACFSIFDTSIADLKIIERQRRSDSRGYLSRVFCAEELETAGWRKPVAQINQTVTKMQGTIRGLHFQHPPHTEVKLVTCLHGAVYDVVVDLRAGSPTFLQWHAEELSASNQRALLIPEGFAHGFQTLVDNCELLYLHSAFYVSEAEAGLNPQDPRLSVSWPLAITELSDRDAKHKILDDDFKGLML
jgi:dTDP-4-dehydrorhamnose 3,5-epimerase